MIFSSSHERIKRAFEYVVKFPFTKPLIHKISETARGKCIAFFSLHRVLEDQEFASTHPHFANKTAIFTKQAHRLIAHINRYLPCISLAEALSYLTGKQNLDRSMAVLVIEVPYVQTMRLITPFLEANKIPATIVLDVESIKDGQMPWMDEIVFRLGSTERREIAVNFIDRSFRLASMADRMYAANHFLEHLSHSNPTILKSRLNHLREELSEVAIHPVGERICTVQQLEKLALNPLFSFASAGLHRLPFFDISVEEAEKEIASSKNELGTMFGNAFVPVYFYSLGSERRRSQEIARIMMDTDFQAAISRNFGVCRPGDNMFRLSRLPLQQGLGSFEQFELQGITDAIDEFLLVARAKDKEF